VQRSWNAARSWLRKEMGAGTTAKV
jgi:hypothetical protein